MKTKRKIKIIKSHPSLLLCDEQTSYPVRDNEIINIFNNYFAEQLWNTKPNICFTCFIEMARNTIKFREIACNSGCKIAGSIDTSLFIINSSANSAIRNDNQVEIIMVKKLKRKNFK